MYFLKIIKYIKFFDYYLEYFAKRLSGKENMIPESNGEFYILEKIIKLCPNEKMNFFDVGSYDLYRIKKNTLLSISYCHHILDDFSYCNLLLLKKGKKSQLQ
tara:strand:- start:27 stop:332 length:306 start_codon:yes stop_codon:yes gene_type:complete